MFMLAAMAAFTTACSSDDPKPNIDDKDETSYSPDPQPTEDVVKTYFTGKVLYWGVKDSKILEYLSRRASNESDLDDEKLQFILLSETSAKDILENNVYFSKVRRFWNKKKALGFITPGKNSLELLERLRNIENTDETQVTEGMVESFSNIEVLIAKADGLNFVMEKNVAQTISVQETQYDEASSSDKESTFTVEPLHNNFVRGRISENICKWLNENVGIEDGTAPALVKTTRGSFEYSPLYSTTTWIQNLSVNYDEVSEYNNPKFSKRTVSVQTTIKSMGVYSDTDNSDVYDVEIKSLFPIRETYYENVVLKTYGLVDYKDKYTGKCYVGPSLDLWVSNSGGEALGTGKAAVFSPAPCIENGQITVTHTPATATFGADVSGGISSSGPELSGGLSASVTMPTESKTKTYSEMKFNYSGSNAHAIWDYYHDGYWIYHWVKGFNGSHEGAYPSAISDKEFEFKLSYKLYNSKSIKDNNLYLNVKPKYEIYSEVCKPKKHTRWTSTWSKLSTKQILLPVVYRYFEKYTPSCYTSTLPATGQEWANLKTWLEGSINYQALSDNAVSVGSRVEKTSNGRRGVEVQAEMIWEETINSIITQRNGLITVDGEWVIGLSDSKGNWIKKGLHIKGNTWKMVDDITQYDHLSPEN